MAERFNVLLVEDNEWDQLAFARFVHAEKLPYDYQIADSVYAAKILLASKHYDVMLLDYSLPDGTSIALLQETSHLPVVIVTGSSDVQIVVEVMKAGAYDYLTKDIQGHYLAAVPITIKNAVERWRAQQELAHYRTHLEKVVVERTAAFIEAEMRIQTIVESTPTLVFSLDTRANFTFIAGNTQAILEDMSHNIIGQSLFSIFPGNPMVLSRFGEALSGSPFTMDIERNGHYLLVSGAAKVESGASAGVIGIIHDISERKRAELEIAQERNLLRTLIDTLPDRIYIKDSEGRFLLKNQVDAQLMGAASPDEAIGKTDFDLFPREMAMQYHADDMAVIESGQALLNREEPVITANGARGWALTSKVPLYDEQGNVSGLVGIGRDITALKQAEEERRQTERLRAEVDNTRQIIEMKQKFITTASHDFRTPLTIIKMNATTLAEYYDRLPREKFMVKLNHIQTQVDRMVRLLDEVLAIGKADSDKLDFSPGPIDLKTFCERVWEDMVEIDKGQHRYDFAFQTNISQITADEDLLQNVFVNLLSNAFKYTQVDGVVRFQVSNDDQMVTFRISDTGYGIPVSEQKHLFEPFFRASNVKNIEGTGLGLAIVKAYVERHGGTISVQSQEGKGTTFVIQFPVHHEG